MTPSPSPAKVFDIIRAEQVTGVAAVPAVLNRWVSYAETRDPGVARPAVVQVGGSLFAPEAYARAERVLGCRIQQVYGMAEGLLCYTRENDPQEVAAGTQGRPICPDDELLIVDEHDRPVPPGVPGQLLVRGPYTPRGYYLAPEHNARSFTTDGWYRTNDLVIRHPSGNLVVVGRTKDVINRGGEKVSADEIERLIQQLDQVADVAVLPLPDVVLGERVCACVVPAPGRSLTLPVLRQTLTDLGVAAYKMPESLVVLDDLPQTSVGKADKKALARMLHATAGQD